MKRKGRDFQRKTRPSPSFDRVARQIMQRDGIERGLVCVLSCVEPCQTYALRRDAGKKRLVLVSGC